MSVFSFFRSLFGIPDRKPPEYSFDRNDKAGPRGNDFRNPIWNMDEDDDDDDDFRHNLREAPGSNFSFQIFTNPLEMHRFFEHQMEQILKSFQNDMTELPPNIGGHDFPALEIPHSHEGSGTQRNLRDKYLKPEYKSNQEQSEHGFSQDKVSDSDLDERIKFGGLDSILKKDRHIDPLPVPIPGQFQSKIFGRSVTSRTVSRPDGTVEHHRTARDSEGNEETTVTRQVGDQSYTVTTKLNPAGVEECTENYVNIDEGDLSDFEKKWKSGLHSGMQPKKDYSPHNWFPFDKFFPSN